MTALMEMMSSLTDPMMELSSMGTMGPAKPTSLAYVSDDPGAQMLAKEIQMMRQELAMMEMQFIQQASMMNKRIDLMEEKFTLEFGTSSADRCETVDEPDYEYDYYDYYDYYDLDYYYDEDYDYYYDEEAPYVEVFGMSAKLVFDSMPTDVPQSCKTCKKKLTGDAMYGSMTLSTAFTRFDDCTTCFIDMTGEDPTAVMS